MPHLIVGGAFAGVLLLEPDFGTVLILTMLLYFMLFIGGARVHHLLATGLMALPAVDLRDDESGVPFAPLDDVSWIPGAMPRAAVFTSFNR